MFCGFPVTSTSCLHGGLVSSLSAALPWTPPLPFLVPLSRPSPNQNNRGAASNPAPAPRRNHPVPITTYLRLKDAKLHPRTQEHPDAITPQGPRSTRTPSHHKDPGAPDAITPQGPRSTQTPLQHKPHAGTQEHRTPLD
ncbi:hypothetical protein STEG23_030864 [Scotinomys teguina]